MTLTLTAQCPSATTPPRQPVTTPARHHATTRPAFVPSISFNSTTVCPPPDMTQAGLAHGSPPPRDHVRPPPHGRLARSIARAGSVAVGHAHAAGLPPGRLACATLQVCRLVDGHAHAARLPPGRRACPCCRSAAGSTGFRSFGLVAAGHAHAAGLPPGRRACPCCRSAAWSTGMPMLQVCRLVDGLAHADGLPRHRAGLRMLTGCHATGRACAC